MNREIIFTAKEYKEKYNGLMQSYLLEYEDYEEIDFVNNEIKRYRDFIKDVKCMIIEKMCEASGMQFYSTAEMLGMPDIYQRLIDFRLEKKCVINFPDLIDDQKEKILILSFNKIIDFLEHKKVNKKTIHILEAEAMEDVYLGQPTNDKANKLFEYLIEYYRVDEQTSVKYVNILHYLKNDVPKDLYIFNLKQVDYKEIIQTKCSIKIKKFAKSERYDDVEKPILNSLLSSFSRQKD
jgi:hypothetical protein